MCAKSTFLSQQSMPAQFESDVKFAVIKIFTTRSASHGAAVAFAAGKSTFANRAAIFPAAARAWRGNLMADFGLAHLACFGAKGGGVTAG